MKLITKYSNIIIYIHNFNRIFHKIIFKAKWEEVERIRKIAIHNLPLQE